MRGPHDPPRSLELQIPRASSPHFVRLRTARNDKLIGLTAEWAAIWDSVGCRAWEHSFEVLQGIEERFQEGSIVNPVIVPKSGGVTTTKASVVRWLKQEGDPVCLGEPLVELETEKVSYELESPAQGFLLKIVARESAEVPVGDALCYIGEKNDVVPQS